MTTDAVVDFDQGRAVRKLWRHVAVLLAAALVGVLAMAAFIAVRGRTYTATIQVVVGQAANLQDLLTFTTTRQPTAATLRDSQLRRLEDDRVRNAVDAQLAGRPAYQVRFNSSATSNVVGVVVTSRNRETARAAANAYGASYVAGINGDEDNLIASTEAQIQGAVDGLTAQITTLEQTLINATSTSLPQVQAIVGPSRDELLQRRGVLERQLDQLRVAKSADLSGARVVGPAELSSSSVTRLLVLGGLAGLLVGIGLAALRERFAGRVDDERDVLAAGTRARAVSTVAVPTPRRPLAVRDERLSDADDGRLRMLAATLWPPHGAAGASQVCLVAPVDGEVGAATALVARLARQLETLGRRVAVVEGDARADGVAQAFGLPTGTGVADLVRGDARLSDVLTRQHGGLLVLPAGRGAQPQDVYRPEFRSLLVELARSVDVVLVVGAPLTGTAEALVVVPLVDRLVVVVAKGRTRRKVLQAFQHSLAEQPVSAPAAEHLDVLLHKVTGRRGQAGAAPASPPAGAPATPVQAAPAGGSARVEQASVRVAD